MQEQPQFHAFTGDTPPAFANDDALKSNASHLFKAAGITFRTV